MGDIETGVGERQDWERERQSGRSVRDRSERKGETGE